MLSFSFIGFLRHLILLLVGKSSIYQLLSVLVSELLELGQPVSDLVNPGLRVGHDVCDAPHRLSRGCLCLRVL